jgi:hypothetical protein
MPVWPGHAVVDRNLPAVQLAGIGGLFGPNPGSFVSRIEGRLAAAIYFFHSDTGACRAPIIFGGS